MLEAAILQPALANQNPSIIYVFFALLHIHELAYTLVKHPTVFLSANVLRLYVQLHALIRRPQSIPEIFHLFATKDMPIPGSNPPKYKKSNP